MGLGGVGDVKKFMLKLTSVLTRVGIEARALLGNIGTD